MAKTAHLRMPFLAPAQAQKHVTVNEGLDALDNAVHCAVIEMFRNDPPADAVDGDRYLIGAAPTGDWTYDAERLAWFSNGGWAFVAPKPGWRVYNLAEDTLYVYSTEQVWTPLSGGGPVTEVQNATRLGLGATADAANPFTAKLNSGLWTARTPAEGGTGNLFLTLNKSDAARDAGYVFQTGFVTRALAGLFGSNRFRIAVSPDGGTFRDGLTIDEATGIVNQPQLPRFKAYTNFDNFGAADAWIKIRINTTETNNQGAFNPVTNAFVAPVAGDYVFGASLLYKVATSSTARLRGRIAVNGTTIVNGSFGEISGGHTSTQTALWLQTVTPLAAGDTVELQGSYRAADGYFAANHTSFWGYKIG